MGPACRLLLDGWLGSASTHTHTQHGPHFPPPAGLPPALARSACVPNPRRCPAPRYAAVRSCGSLRTPMTQDTSGAAAAAARVRLVWGGCYNAGGARARMWRCSHPEQVTRLLLPLPLPCVKAWAAPSASSCVPPAARTAFAPGEVGQGSRVQGQAVLCLPCLPAPRHPGSYAARHAHHVSPASPPSPAAACGASLTMTWQLQSAPTQPGSACCAGPPRCTCLMLRPSQPAAAAAATAGRAAGRAAAQPAAHRSSRARLRRRPACGAARVRGARPASRRSRRGSSCRPLQATFISTCAATAAAAAARRTERSHQMCRLPQTASRLGTRHNSVGARQPGGEQRAARRPQQRAAATGVTGASHPPELRRHQRRRQMTTARPPPASGLPRSASFFPEATSQHRRERMARFRRTRASGSARPCAPGCSARRRGSARSCSPSSAGEATTVP